jgi:WXG100 family type VII secretion target
MRTGPQDPTGYVPAVGSISGGQGFVTDTHVMVSAQQYISHVGDVMTTEVDKLMSNLDNLNPSTWRGDAYQAFLKAKLQWHDAHNNIKNALRDIEERVGRSAKRYDQADQDSQYSIDNAVKGLDYTIPPTT